MYLFCFLANFGQVFKWWEPWGRDSFDFWEFEGAVKKYWVLDEISEIDISLDFSALQAFPMTVPLLIIQSSGMKKNLNCR